ncbi:19750_t:CDS:2, partial [Entrophospora sp. SA101]
SNKNQNNVYYIRWAMVGSPMKIGFYSKDTRRLEMTNRGKTSGTDLDDIIDMFSSNNHHIINNIL